MLFVLVTASSEILGYVDAPVELGITAVHHVLLAVGGIAFPLLIDNDILTPYNAMFTLDEATPLRLLTRVCDIYREQCTDFSAAQSNSFLTAYAAFRAVIEPCTTALITVRMPRNARLSNHRGQASCFVI